MEYWSIRVMEYWSNGVMEYWSNGVLSFFITPILYYSSSNNHIEQWNDEKFCFFAFSITPSLQYSNTPVSLDTYSL